MSAYKFDMHDNNNSNMAASVANVSHFATHLDIHTHYKLCIWVKGGDTTVYHRRLTCMQGSHFSCDTKFHVFSKLFPGKSNQIQGQFGFESVFVLIM